MKSFIKNIIIVAYHMSNRNFGFENTTFTLRVAVFFFLIV